MDHNRLTTSTLASTPNNNLPTSSLSTNNQALSLPKNGQIFLGSELIRESELTITTPKSDSFFIKLKDKDGNDVFSFFVLKDTKITIRVPARELYAYFAYGSKWYGEEKLFGDTTVYQKDSAVCDFTQYSYEYSFKESFDGNFNATSISAKDF